MFYAALEPTGSGVTTAFDTATESLRDGLLQAALSTGAVEAAHLYTDSGVLAPRIALLQRREFGDRIESRHLAQLPILATQHDYVWVTSEPSLGAVSTLRSALNGAAFPTSTVLAGPLVRDSLGKTVQMLLGAQPWDSMIVPGPSVAAAVQYSLDTAREWLQTVTTNSCQGPSVECLPAHVDTETFRPREPEYCRDALGLPRDRIIVTAALRNESRRGSHDGLLAALSEVASWHPRVLLLLAAPDASAYLTDTPWLLRELMAKDLVRGVSGIPEHVKPLYYGASDVFVCLDDSVMPGSGLQTLEAMASGVAVIASAWMTNKDLIRDGDTGVLIPTLWDPVAATMLGWLSAGEWCAQFAADRTIVDVHCLTRCLDSILRSEDLRRSLGTRAHDEALAEHSSQAVGTRARELWSDQRARFTAPGHRPPFSLDFSGMLQLLGSRALDDTCRLRLTATGRHLTGDALHEPDLADVSPLLRSEASRIGTMLELAPTCVGDCIADRELAFEAVVWLLKRGWVEIVPGESS